MSYFNLDYIKNVFPENTPNVVGHSKVINEFTMLKQTPQANPKNLGGFDFKGIGDKMME